MSFGSLFQSRSQTVPLGKPLTKRSGKMSVAHGVGLVETDYLRWYGACRSVADCSTPPVTPPQRLSRETGRRSKGTCWSGGMSRHAGVAGGSRGRFQVGIPRYYTPGKRTDAAGYPSGGSGKHDFSPYVGVKWCWAWPLRGKPEVFPAQSDGFDARWIENYLLAASQ